MRHGRQRARTPKHPYHLVDPSPWPASARSARCCWRSAPRSACIPTCSARASRVSSRRSAGGSWLPASLVVFAACTWWWRDVIVESRTGPHAGRAARPALRHDPVHRLGGDVLRSPSSGPSSTLRSIPIRPRCRAHRGHRRLWPPKGVSIFDPFDLPFMNTLILLLSGTTVTWAHHALLEGNNRERRARPDPDGRARHLLHRRPGLRVRARRRSASSDSIYSSTFFMATGFHGFHVIVGTIFLLVCLFRAMKGQFKPNQHFGFEAAAWYWHFVDVVWLFLFFCIYWWGAGQRADRAATEAASVSLIGTAGRCPAASLATADVGRPGRADPRRPCAASVRAAAGPAARPAGDADAAGLRPRSSRHDAGDGRRVRHPGAGASCGAVFWVEFTLEPPCGCTS